MLNIVIVCGGTGSIQLQKGFSGLLGRNNYNLDIVINAYDNGKSTGECRKAFDCNILGASDLRKNQLTLYEIFYEKELTDIESYEMKVLQLFELRYSADNYKEYYQKSLACLEEADYFTAEQKEKLIRWLNYFFLKDLDGSEFRDEIKELNYTDFSLSNIFYSSSAAMNANSLAAAGSELSVFLKIPDSVHLVSDKNLFLQAETESGYIIEDEERIVAWNNSKDRITRAILRNREGEEYIPFVDEGNLNDGKVTDLFKKADIIILSSGTQWSSLIPTYMHKGFYNLLSNTKAAKYLVMNNMEDHDMYGVCANDLLHILEKWIPVKATKIVVNKNAVPSMNSISCDYEQISDYISSEGSKKHNPEKLAGLIMEDYFGISDKHYFLISDLDGTLWEERGSDYEKTVGIENLGLFEGIIFSGNTYDHVKEVTAGYFKNQSSNPVYSDYGNTKIMDGTTYCVDESFLIDDDILNEIDSVAEFKGKASLRGGCVITVKPLKDREKWIRELDKIVRKYDGKYECHIAGKTSIDIQKIGLDKSATLARVITQEGLDAGSLLYIGNELDEGNEVCIRDLNLKTIQVKDVVEMNNFIKIYNRKVGGGQL